MPGFADIHGRPAPFRNKGVVDGGWERTEERQGKGTGGENGGETAVGMENIGKM